MSEDIGEEVVELIKRMEGVLRDTDSADTLVNALASMMISNIAEVYKHEGLSYTQARAAWTDAEETIRLKLFEVLLERELSQSHPA